ncbi:MAG: hypothetical protein JKX74_03875, partial [Flavobacteriales bacterium]|nr:hypothetical protein [Flavobacteriales bacterium]
YESDLREANLDGQDRYSQFSFAIPVGVGINYRINRRISLDLGTEMHFTFTDNLDNVSSEGTGVREGEANLERFLYTSLTLRFNIGKDDPQPPIEPEDSCLVDDDNDGVNNCKDECPETPDSVAVDSVGCPVLDTAAIVVADTLKNDTLVADSGKIDTLQKGTLEAKCLWTVVLGKFGKGQFPSADFINQVLSIPGVWTEVSNDTTLYIKELYESPEEAEVQRINIANNTSIKDCRVLLWTKMLECDENVDMDKVRALLLKSDQLNDKDVFLRVQIGAFSTLIATDFFNISDVVMIPGKDGLYKYVTGDFKNDLESAVAHREAMVRKGFEDAFIVVYRGGERVTLEEVGMSQNAANLDTAGVEIKPGEQIIEFKIQIYASTDAIYLVPANFKEIENIEEYKDENLFKYTFGAVSDFGYARDVLLNQMLRIGYKDAFVVAFLNGKRITVEKALELLDQ